MRKILVAYDGSESSDHALQFALEQIHERPMPDIYLLNIQVWPVLYNEYMAPLPVDEIHQSLKIAGSRILQPALDRLKALKRPCHSAVQLGDIPHGIVEHAENQGCTQIVMGSRGMGSLKGLLAGSVATRVIHLANIPVTVVK